MSRRTLPESPRLALFVTALALALTGLLLAGPSAAQGARSATQPKPRAALADAVTPAPAAVAAPEDSDPWGEARQLADAGRYEAALGVLRAALKRQGDDFGLRWLEAGITGDAGRHVDAAALYTKLAADHPARAGELLDDAGTERLLAGDAAGAARDFRGWLKVHPGDRPAQRRLALALAQADSLRPALAAYDSLLAREPGDAGLALERARVLGWMGRHAEAVAAYRAVLAQDPTVDDARLGIAMNENWAGRHRTATRQLEAIASDPAADPEAGKALAFARYWDGDAPGARIAVDDYLRRVPDDAEARTLSKRLARERAASLRFEGGRADDSDGLRVVNSGMELRVPIATAATGLLRWRRDNVRDASGTRDPLRLTAGLQQAFGPAWSAHGECTRTDWNDGPGTVVGGELGLVSRPVDRVRLEAVASREPVMTRRSLELGISLLAWTGAADLGLGERVSLHADARAGRYSDGNGMERSSLVLGWTALSRRRTDLTLNVSAEQLHVHFDPGSGYYAPAFHREWGPGAEAQWRPREDWMLGVTSRVGWQRDRDAETESLYALSGRIEFTPQGGLSFDLEGGRSDSSLESAGGYRRTWWQAGITRGF
jgi:tetratricopeptide (TPR) repeat protein